MVLIEKRDNRFEEFSLEKFNINLKKRLNYLNIKNLYIPNIEEKITNNISSSDFCSLISETFISLSYLNPDYDRLATNFNLSNIYKETNDSFSDSIVLLFNVGLINTNVYNFVQNNRKILDSKINNYFDDLFSYSGLNILMEYTLKINKKYIERPQYLFMRVAIGAYMNRLNINTIINHIFKIYDLLSSQKIIFSSPILLNSCTNKPQLASCFLLDSNTDINDKFETLKKVADISSNYGGIGIHTHNIQKNKLISLLKLYDFTIENILEFNRRKPGIVTYLETWHIDILDFLDTKLEFTTPEKKLKYINIGLWISDNFMEKFELDDYWKSVMHKKFNGLYSYHDLYLMYKSDKYKETVTKYFLGTIFIDKLIENKMLYKMYYKNELKKYTEEREQNLIRYYKKLEYFRDYKKLIMFNDKIIKNLTTDVNWILLCPKEFPGLSNVYGSKFNNLYSKYEYIVINNEKKIEEFNFIKTQRELDRAEKKEESNVLYLKNYYNIIKIDDIIKKIYTSQVETGYPYICFKDSVNMKSNQQNIGIIKSSNLCTEIMQYSSKDNIATCNLGSIVLNKFVKDNKFDFDELKDIVYTLTLALDNIIDVNYYLSEESKRSNLDTRPLGIGVQGFADVLQLLKIPYESEECKILNVQIFETIYYAALSASVNLSILFGSYKYYQGSPISNGFFQFDLWNINKENKNKMLWDWESLKEEIRTYKLRNSLLIAVMPTATTANILGNSESIEPYISNIFSIRTKYGDYLKINKNLIEDLKKNNCWNIKIRNELIKNRGSVQNLDIPDELKKIYKTVWEISQKYIIDLAADRGKFICQSQSLNLHLEDPSGSLLKSIYKYLWKSGLKTGIYYLRTKPAINPIQVDSYKFLSSIECSGCT